MVMTGLEGESSETVVLLLIQLVSFITLLALPVYTTP